MSRPHGGSEDKDPRLLARLQEVRDRIGFVVRCRRGDLGLTQEQVAESLGCTTSHYQRVEYAQASVSLAMLAHLSIVLECELEDMLQPLPATRQTLDEAAN